VIVDRDLFDAVQAKLSEQVSRQRQMLGLAAL
jgi:hypothetical protein